MESKKSVVSSFDVDHLTLREGLYLRSVYTINDELAVHSWDMRFRAPMDYAPLGSGEVHTIEHLMAYYLRLDPVIGKSIVSFCPMGCKTGFYLSTMNDVTAEQMKDWARMMDIEFIHITKDTTVDSLEKELFLNDLAWKLK